MRDVNRFAALCLLALVVASCSSSDGADSTTTRRVATTAAATTAAPTTTSTTESPVLDTRDLFTQISPSVAFITTDTGTGSGVLIEGGWLVTNAHVVWPFDEVRVVFPDGDEINAAPVVRSNVYEDLAVIGPLDVSAPPLTMPVEDDYAVGDTVYLVGYPGEVERFPTPAITQGVVSRVREWEQADMTFIQTDALIAGGQSGGALVSSQGELIGISGLGGFTESNFALVAAGEDLAPRVQQLLDGDTPDRFDGTLPRQGSAATEHAVDLASVWHGAVFVLNEPDGTDVSIELDSANHSVDLTDSIGFSLSTDEQLGPRIEATTEFDEPHFVFVSSNDVGPSGVVVSSSHPLSPLVDPDDDKQVNPGVTVRGVLDVSGDLDVYRIDLAEGETILVSVDGLSDMVLWVDQIGNPDDSLGFDDDSGGGLYGTSAEIDFTAPADGEYLILVTDVLFEPGVGYILTVE